MVPTKFCEVLLVRKLQITCFSVLVTSLLVRSVVLTLQGFSSFSLVVLNLWSHLLWASYDQQFAFHGPGKWWQKRNRTMLPMQFSPLVKSSLEVIKVPEKSSSTSKQAFQKQQYRLRNVNKHKSRSSETSLITNSARSKRLLISFTTIYFPFLFFLFLHLLVNVFCSVCHRLSSVTPSL